MKVWFIRFSIASAVLLAIACGDDDSASDEAGAGEGGEPGHAHGGAGGSDSTSAGAAGADGSEAGAGGAPAGPMCEPPTPPLVGEGGAGGVGGAGEPTSGALAIVGEYTDGFSDHIVTTSSWMIDSSVFHISAFDDAQGWLLARNDQENPFSPCLWSRFDWTRVDSKLYYCQAPYDAPSEAAARDAEAPDASDPANSGCGEANFAWSELTEK